MYDWTITDKIFDAMRDAGVRPLVEVGFMPEALSTHPEPYRHTFPDGDVFTGWSYPPKDYDKWSALVTAWVKHLHERYGDAAGKTWLWEVWNEPDIPYWHGTPEEYDRLYDVTAEAIQKELPEAKIGGPEATEFRRASRRRFFGSFWSIVRMGRTRLQAGRVLRWRLSAFIRRVRRRRWTGMCGWISGINCARRSWDARGGFVSGVEKYSDYFGGERS